MDYPRLKTEVRAFWTDTDLYLLFILSVHVSSTYSCPRTTHTPGRIRGTATSWRSSSGSDWQISGTIGSSKSPRRGDRIDLAIDLDRDLHDENWRSGWVTTARIDPATHVWYAAARIPLSAVDSTGVHAGTRWRMNLYRTDGLGPDPQRHFLCWQPTCVVDRYPNHVPENFGTLVFKE